MSRDRQSEIKDVGGFVGGYCSNGNRTDVHHRSMLTLDADFGDAGLWEDYNIIYGNAAAIYSTHKHKPDAPRLRLVIPLDRDVSPDEYQAISRRVAEALGIDKFDDTTYQPQRLMYWPSCSYDGEYVFEHTDGPFLSADEILATYTDWKDMSAWPMSSRVSDIARKSAEKQKDPTEKEGLIGAFCRTYTIQEAIEAYVPDYEPCADGRYTYTKGSTAAGVVIYDDKFSYSHHSTDPAGGQLCNAWDLVRIHQFVELDADKEEGTPPTKLPSYRAMTELALRDPTVRVAAIKERQERTEDDFEAIPDDQEEDDAWMKELKLTEKGAIANTIDNVVRILENDPKINGLAINDFHHIMVVKKDLPWRKITSETDSTWTDTDDALLRHYLESTYGLTGKDRIFDGCNVAAQHNSFHPVRDYLQGLKWDGVQRAEEILIKYLGAKDTEYTRAVTRKHLAASVGRILRPGIKYDTVLTIKGRQGLGKSTLIARLGGAWYSDSFTTVTGKEAYEQVQGVWIVEIGELAGMKKAEVETTKLFVSKTEDRFRPAYGRRIESFPRQCVFWATTNETQFLRDATGNRRWLIVETPNPPEASVWKDLTQAEVDQIWAEAKELYEKGEPLYLDRKLEAEAQRIQSAYTEENSQAGIVEDYLERLLPEDWENMELYERREWLKSDGEGTEPRQAVTYIEIWAEAFGNDPAKIDRYAVKDLRDIMQAMTGWEYAGEAKRRSKLYGRQRYYRRTDDYDI